jgi:phosphoribosylformylglycinamidine synthase
MISVLSIYYIDKIILFDACSRATVDLSEALPMVHRLEIATRPPLSDPRGAAIAATLHDFLGIPDVRVRTRDVHRIDADLSDAEARRVLHEFVDPVSQQGALGRLDDGPFGIAITVAYKPGVTDPVGKSARVCIEDTLGRKLGDDAAVYTSTMYLLEGVDVALAERIATELLANPVIQTIRIETYDAWRQADVDLTVPRIAAHATPAVVTIDLSGSDEALLALSKSRLLALSLAEMQAVRDHFRRASSDEKRIAAGLGPSPTDVELECIAQTWSEHCKHKIFNATVTYREPGKAPETIRSLFKTFIRGATEAVDEATRAGSSASWLVSVFEDNAGVVAFDEHSHLVYKVETHNSPSALDPYGGAITGIVGVNRDPFGTGRGAELLANVWGYCFASPFFEGSRPAGLLHPRRIRDGVHQGVIDGGNQSGVPYGRGFEIFDARFLGKPLVFCGTVGRLPVTIAGTPGETKTVTPGDRIVMVGGRIGADGIHGATFSSAALDESAPIQAVQIGDPITQKRMFDFLIEARDRGLYASITDNGAGGLSSSVGEMAKASGGARLDLAKAPLKYAGLAPWEIFLSEAQERMTLAVPEGDVSAFLELARRREVEATVIGNFTDSGYLELRFDGETVAVLDMTFLHEGDPDLDLPAVWEPKRFAEPAGPAPADLGETLLAMLSRLNLCSNEAKARHYDHEVKGLTVVKPWVGAGADVPAEATVFLLRHGGKRGYVLSEGINPFYSDIDTYAMARAVLDEAVRKQLCAGARLDRIAALDNFCWPDPVLSDATPDGAYKMAQLVRACRGLYDLARAYRTPLVSGKDSMKNDSTMGGVKISVPPTLLVSTIGQIDDVADALTLDAKLEGDVVYLLGATRDETGGSEYFRLRGERDGATRDPGGPAPYVGNRVPTVDAAETLPLYRALEAASRRRLVRSVATPAKGGLALALARCAMAGELGMDLDLDQAPDLDGLPPDVALFSESNGRFVVMVAAKDAAAFSEHFAGLACRRIGVVTSAAFLRVKIGGKARVELSIAAMKAAYKETLAHV